MHKRYPAVVLCAAALAAAGCGSSNTHTDKQATTAGPVSQGVFTTDVNTLCQTAKTAGGGSLAKEAAGLSQALSQLKAITPPTTDQAAYSEFIAHVQALASATKSGNSAAAHAEAAKLNALAKQLHLSGCKL